MPNPNFNSLQSLTDKTDILAKDTGSFLVKFFHYLALFVIGAAIVWGAAFEFLSMVENGAASIEDILLLLDWECDDYLDAYYN